MVATAAATTDLPADQRTDLQAGADALLQAAATPTPDPLQMRRLAEDLLATLRTTTPTLASQAAIAKGEQALLLRG